MFKIEKPKEITWPVTISIPRDGGNTTKATFTGKFKLLPQTEFNAIYSNGGTDDDLIRNAMTGWGEDMCDESGQPLQYNDDNLSMIAAVPYIRAAIIAAYLELSHGKKAGAKN